jgi:hypothetical protein
MAERRWALLNGRAKSANCNDKSGALHHHKVGNCKIRFASKILYTRVKRSAQIVRRSVERVWDPQTLFLAMCMRITPQMANPCINKVLLLKCDNYKS